MKKWRYLFTALAILLSNVMCFVVAYLYRGVQCDIAHAGFSAPASIAFFYAIPFLVGILVCGILAFLFWKKEQ